MEPTTADRADALPPTTDLPGEAPTVALNTGLLPSMSQHCTRCGSELAPDQRYCVACGERRGEPRLPFMDGRPPAPETVQTTTVTAAPAPPRSRWGSGATLIAGVGTLLLALGVGVLIGNAGKDDATPAAAAPQVITVNGGAAAAPTDTTATDASADAGSSAKDDATSKDGGKADGGDSKPQAAAVKKVVTTPGGGDVPQAAAPLVKQGQKGSGPGYKDGKFTGDFFGQ